MNIHGFGSPPSQRRLRHLKCIIIRNLIQDTSSPTLGAYYYTLHAQTSAIEYSYDGYNFGDCIIINTPENAVDIDRINSPLTPESTRHTIMNGIAQKTINTSYPTTVTSNTTNNNSSASNPTASPRGSRSITSPPVNNSLPSTTTPNATGKLTTSWESVKTPNGHITRDIRKRSNTGSGIKNNSSNNFSANDNSTNHNDNTDNSQAISNIDLTQPDKTDNETAGTEQETEDTNLEPDVETETTGTEQDDQSRPQTTTADLYRGEPIIVDENEELPPPFYTSEVVTNTCNPTWRHLDCSRFHLLDFVDIVHNILRLPFSPSSCKVMTDNTTDMLTPILQYEIDLVDLEYIGNDLRQIGYYVFPQNALIFELKDGLYVTKDTRDSMRPSRGADLKTPTTDKPKKHPTTCNQFAFVSLIAKKRTLMQAQDASSQLSSSIESKLEHHSNYFERCNHRDDLRLRIERLREECASAKASLKTDEDMVKSIRNEVLPRARTLARAQVALLATKQQLNNQESKALDKDKEALRALKESYDFRQWYLVSQIRTIYTIQQSDGKSLSVNGFRLPNSDFTGCDEEQIATALGYVSHILYLAAKYLEVPLRYPMIPMCSRSMILDEISQQTSPKFPLYSRGVDRTRFEYAVFLLNKNLEQLLNSQDLSMISLRHTLPNVQMLLSKPRGNSN